MSEAFREEYDRTQSIADFEGTASIRYISNGLSNGNKGSANLNQPLGSINQNNDCNKDIGVGGEDDPPNLDDDIGYICTSTLVWVDSYVTADPEGGKYDVIFHSDYQVVVWECRISFGSTANGSDPCNNDSPEEIAMIDPNKPCPADALKNMKIAATAGQGINGGRYGALRIGENGQGIHKGFDAGGAINDPVFATHKGTVVAAIGGVAPNTMGSNGDFGNYVIVASEINGKTYWILYAHLNSINASYGPIAAGQKIGQIGKTGNASDERNTKDGILTPVNPHVHMEFRVFEEGVNFNYLGTENPENFFNTKFDQQGNPIKNENCL